MRSKSRWRECLAGAVGVRRDGQTVGGVLAGFLGHRLALARLRPVDAAFDPAGSARRRSPPSLTGGAPVAEAVVAPPEPVEHDLVRRQVLAAPHEQRGAGRLDLVADARGRRARAPGRSRAPRPDRPPGRPRGACARRGSRCAGRRRRGPAARAGRGARRRGHRAFRPAQRWAAPVATSWALLPRTWRTSSWYLSRAPSVSSTSAGVSSSAPSAMSAAAQSSVSAMPGTLVRSVSRSCWTNATTWRARPSGTPGRRVAHDLVLLLRGRVVDPVVEAAPLERVVDLAGAVGREDDPRRPLGPDRADLRHRDLEVADRISSRYASNSSSARSISSMSSTGGGPSSASSACSRGRLMRKSGAKMSCAVAWRRGTLRLQQPDLEHLARVVPLVDGGVDVQALVALEADERRPERRGEDLGDLRLAHAGLALEEQRAAQLEGQEDRRGKRSIGDVAARPEGRLDTLDRQAGRRVRHDAVAVALVHGVHGPESTRRARRVSRRLPLGCVERVRIGRHAEAHVAGQDPAVAEPGDGGPTWAERR